MLKYPWLGWAALTWLYRIICSFNLACVNFVAYFKHRFSPATLDLAQSGSCCNFFLNFTSHLLGRCLRGFIAGFVPLHPLAFFILHIRWKKPETRLNYYFRLGMPNLSKRFGCVRGWVNPSLCSSKAFVKVQKLFPLCFELQSWCFSTLGQDLGQKAFSPDPGTSATCPALQILAYFVKLSCLTVITTLFPWK